MEHSILENLLLCNWKYRWSTTECLDICCGRNCRNISSTVYEPLLFTLCTSFVYILALFKQYTVWLCKWCRKSTVSGFYQNAAKEMDIQPWGILELMFPNLWHAFKHLVAEWEVSGMKISNSRSEAMILPKRFRRSRDVTWKKTENVLKTYFLFSKW